MQWNYRFTVKEVQFYFGSTSSVHRFAGYEQQSLCVNGRHMSGGAEGDGSVAQQVQAQVLQRIKSRITPAGKNCQVAVITVTEE